jgi:hypothetical protein
VDDIRESNFTLEQRLHYMDKLSLFLNMKKELQDEEGVLSVQIDEEFIPPHKSAAYTPYDAVICLDESVVDEEESKSSKNAEPSLDRIIKRNNIEVKKKVVKDMLQDIEYEDITGITENNMSEPGDYLAYVSLRNPEWIEN